MGRPNQFQLITLVIDVRLSMRGVLKHGLQLLSMRERDALAAAKKEAIQLSHIALPLICLLY